MTSMLVKEVFRDHLLTWWHIKEEDAVEEDLAAIFRILVESKVAPLLACECSFQTNCGVDGLLQIILLCKFETGMQKFPVDSVFLKFARCCVMVRHYHKLLIAAWGSLT